MTPLEALEKIKRELSYIEFDEEQQIVLSAGQDYEEETDTIEKSLKALEIIKNHKLLNYILKNEKCASMYHLSKEEINLLKEVIKND